MVSSCDIPIDGLHDVANFIQHDVKEFCYIYHLVIYTVFSIIKMYSL